MTRFDDLDRSLGAYLEGEATAPAPAGLLEAAMTRTATRRPRATWRARLHTRGVRAPRGETARTLAIAAALVLLLMAIVAGAMIGGGNRPRLPLADDSSPSVEATASARSDVPASATTPAATPVEAAMRATWLADTRPLASLGTGSGPVHMSIDFDGTSLSAENFAPNAEFESSVGRASDGNLRLVLIRPSGGCPAGAAGTYRGNVSEDGAQLALSAIADDCPTRAEALSRRWGRSLTDPTSVGRGFVTTMQPAFRIDLPDDSLSARTLTDFVEIGGSNDFGLLVFKNPQGFADPCTQAKRFPYTPGADAFAAYLGQNPALHLVSSEELTLAGHHAVHVVYVAKSDYAPCPTPPEGFMLWTPKDCECHFVLGPGDRDSLFLVDVGTDTFMFEVFPVDETKPAERQILDSLQIPATLPSG